MAFDTTRFLNQVKMKMELADGKYEDQEILDIAYDAVLSEVQPFIISMREEYYVKCRPSAVVEGQAAYRIDTRALGGVLRELKLDVEGVLVDLDRMDPEDVTRSDAVGTPRGFYLEGVAVVLYPAPSRSTGSLVQSFFQRASRPVVVEDCAQVSSIDAVTGVVTCSAPAGWETASAYDLVSADNGNDILARDLVAAAVDTSSLTFQPGDLPSTLAVGDYICLAGECPFIMVPDEALNYVQQLTICELLEAQGSLAELQPAMAKLDRLKESLSRILSQRVQGASKKFQPQF